MKRSRKAEPRTIEVFEAFGPDGELEFRTETLSAAAAYLDQRNVGLKAAKRARMVRQRYQAVGKARPLRMAR